MLLCIDARPGVCSGLLSTAEHAHNIIYFIGVNTNNWSPYGTKLCTTMLILGCHYLQRVGNVDLYFIIQVVLLPKIWLYCLLFKQYNLSCTA